MFNEMDKARNIIGVCPQHDVLFDNLTPEEHLSVFCDFKGFNGNKSEEIDKILKDVDLLHLRSTVAKKPIRRFKEKTFSWNRSLWRIKSCSSR